MRKFLSVILLFLLIAPAIADDQCPMGYSVVGSRFIEVTNLLNDGNMSLTPMIDVMTTLLAVFMVTTPMMTTGIDLNLPRGGNSAMTGSDHAIQISVNKNGQYFLAQNQMSLDQIVTSAAAMRGENPQLTIMINGDTQADYGAVMAVMGRLKDAGFQKVGLRTKPNK